MNPESNASAEQFDPNKLRLWVGGIALALPGLVLVFSSTPLPSISASYYTESRDIFVGSMAIIGALFWSFNSPRALDKFINAIASISAFLVAVLPTACGTCKSSPISITHYICAGILFISSSYICFFVFSKRAREKIAKDSMAKNRASVYVVCGWIIILAIAAALVGDFVLPLFMTINAPLTFYAELVCLWSFALAWLVASKMIWWLVADKDERLILFGPREKVEVKPQPQA